jgi:hypothetical protein
MRFLLGTSFFDGGKPERQETARLWVENIARMDVKPTKIVAIGEGGARVPSFWGDVVRLTGDLGHIHQHLDGGPKSHHAFTGWSASVMALALLAYIDEADFVYRESDCLAFGPWVAQLYRDCGDHGWVFGQKMKSAPWMACAQSLFMVKHSMIPNFVRGFLINGPENDRARIGETRFIRMEDTLGRAGRLSFGVDRERPIPWDAPAFYFQQPTRAELEEAARRNLITL